jgi:hypothetical protein
MSEDMSNFSGRTPKRLLDNLKDEAWKRRISLSQLMRDLFQQEYDRTHPADNLPTSEQAKVNSGSKP